MPVRKVANFHRIARSGTASSFKRKLSAVDPPAPGDLCFINASGLPQFQVTTSATAGTQLLDAICIDGRSEFDTMNNSGVTLFNGTQPTIVQIGGRGSRDDNSTGKRRLFVPITPDLLFFIDCDEVAGGGHTVVIGNQYGIKRIVGDAAYTAGNNDQLGRYVLDVANFATTGGTAVAPGANSAVEVISFWSPDIDLGLTGAPQTFEGVANKRAGVLVRALKGAPAV